MFSTKMIENAKAMALIVLTSVALMETVYGSTLQYSDTVLVRGSESLTVVELPFQAPGAYRVTTKDLKWLDVPLQALSFGVFTATQPIETLSTAGTIEFFKAGADRVFVQIYTRPTAPQFAGLVSLYAEASVVPLPPSAVLLGAPLSAYAVWRTRMRQKRRSDARARARSAEALRLFGLVRLIVWVAFVWLMTPAFSLPAKREPVRAPRRVNGRAEAALLSMPAPAGL